MFSPLARLVRANGYEPRFGNLVPEFERVVTEARPDWYLMENVPQAPIPAPVGYHPPHVFLLNNRWLGSEQFRLRRFCFGVRDDLAPVRLDVSPDIVLLEQPITYRVVTSSDRETPVKIGANGKIKSTHPDYLECGGSSVTANVGGKRAARVEYQRQGGSVTAAHGYERDNHTVISGNGLESGSDYLARQGAAVTSSDGSQRVKMVRYSLAEACRLQGWPELAAELADAPFTAAGKLKLIANGVPREIGRALGRAIGVAMGMAGRVTT